MISEDIESFIKLFENNHSVTVVSAVLFGSSLHKNDNKIDDIDLFLVLAEDKVFRGNHYISDVRRVDYFSGSLSILKKHLENAKGTIDTLPFFILGEGKVLFGEDKISHLTQMARNYIVNFPGYLDRDNLLSILWYKLTDSYADLTRTTDPMITGMLIAEALTTAMEFYCVYRNELIKKRGTNDRGEFYKLYSDILTSPNQADGIKKLIDFLSLETGRTLNNDWEVQYL